jgi:hypothetical protein
MAHKAVVRITTRNPLKRAVPWTAPAGPVSIADPVALSMTPFGDWVEIDLQQRILIAGASGSGKSSVQRVLSASVVLAVDAELEVWDLKQGTESQHYEGLAALRITTAAECRARIEQLLTEELPRRAAIMQARRTSTWPTSPQFPDRIIQVDEGAALIRDLDEDDLDRLFTLIEQARAYGIYLWWATQFPKSDNLPTQIRSQMSAVVALKMRRASESRVVFEELSREGWTPHRLPGKGWLLLLDDDHPDPVESRAAWLHEDDFRRLQRPTPSAPAGMSVPPMPAAPPRIPAPAAAVDDAPRLSLVKDSDAPAAAPPAAAVPEPAAAELSTPDAVLQALAAASGAGMSAAELQVATGRGKTQVYAAIQQLKDDTRIVKLGHGRYGLPAQKGETA